MLSMGKCNRFGNMIAGLLTHRLIIMT